MSAINSNPEAPHVVLIDGRLYGSGDSQQQAFTDFRAQLAGALPEIRASMTARAEILPVSAEHASDVAEMRDADAIAWRDPEDQNAEQARDETVEDRFAQYEKQSARFEQGKASVLPTNKTALFEALAAAGVQTVVVCFDGCGDSGQIESITGLDANDSELPLPGEAINILQPVFDDGSVNSMQVTPLEAIETMAYDLLQDAHDGWGNDDGAFGEFTFSVADRTITLDYNERFTDSTNYQHEF